MATETPNKKSRRPNFSEDELLVLTNEVKNRKQLIIGGKFDTGETVNSRPRAIESAWEAVTVEVMDKS